MSLTARICTHQNQPWMVIEAPPLTAGDEPLVIYDGPLNLSSKTTIKAEIDWAYERTGLARADLYDCIRHYQNTIRRERGRAA